MQADRGKAEEHFSFEFETEKLGRVCCRPLNFKLLFRFTNLIKSAPDTVRDFACTLLSVVGERRDVAVPEDRVISGEQAKAIRDQDLEQFAARFLEAVNWSGLGGGTQPTSEGADERSHSERLKRAFEMYERGLAEQTTSYPLLDVFSDAVLSSTEDGSRLIMGPSIEAEKPAFWNPTVRESSRFSNGGHNQWNRTVGMVPAKFRSFFGNIGENWQKQNGGIAQHIRGSLATLKTLKQELVNREIRSHTRNKIGEQVEKIWGSLKALRTEANEWAIKVASDRVLLGVVIIGLSSAMFLYLIARANSRLQEVTAIRNLADTVHSLSERTETQTRELAELIKRYDSEQKIAAQRAYIEADPAKITDVDPKPQKGRKKHGRRYSSVSGQDRKSRTTLPSRALN